MVYYTERNQVFEMAKVEGLSNWFGQWFKVICFLLQTNNLQPDQQPNL
jgi:hypothetical protein